MKPVPLLTMFAGCLLLGVASADAADTGAANRLPNPSFEEMDGGKSNFPTLWKAFAPEPGPRETWAKAARETFTTDHGVAHSGKNAIKISSKEVTRAGVAMDRFVEVVPGQRWKFSAWVKGEGLSSTQNSGAWIRLIFNDRAAKEETKGAPIYGRTYAEKFDWIRLECEGVVPPNCNNANVGMFLWITGGTVWFDDAAFELVADAK